MQNFVVCFIFFVFMASMELPIWEYREKFIQMLNKHQCILINFLFKYEFIYDFKYIAGMIVSGIKGSGKTTQIPQLCLDFAR